MAAYVFYNPLAGNGSGETVARDLTAQMGEHYLIDMTKITNYEAIIAGMGTEDYLVIVGGDGTLNRFANETAKLRIQQQMLRRYVKECNLLKRLQRCRVLRRYRFQ